MQILRLPVSFGWRAEAGVLRGRKFAQGFALEFQPVAGSTGDPGLADAGGDGRMPHLTQGYPAFVAWRWGLHSAPGIVIREWRSSRRAELTTA